jgi:hypothetical protein
MSSEGPRRNVASITIHAIAARRRTGTIHRRCPFVRNRSTSEVVVNDDRLRLLWCSTDDLRYRRRMAVRIRIGARRSGR